ncbi:stemmadenine O-acetyltransferase [Trifolium repens]|nr:stemmadenine O-acetyltransferase [Trifolium repens]
MDSSEPLMSFQINCFACGGMAISTCVSHKLADATTFFNFMNDWAIINRKVEKEEKEDNEEENGLLVLPVSKLLDGGASAFPQGDLPIFPELFYKRENNVVCKRFVFQPSMINFLKEMATSSSTHSPTRILVLIAWIYKCLVSKMELNFKTSSFIMPVNLRKIMVPPLSEKCVGNIIWFLFILADEKEMELKDLVCKIKEGLSEFYDVYPKIFGEKEKDKYLSLISECLKQATQPRPDNENSFTFSSWCRLPIYETDFGWGKPTWVTTCGSSSRNVILMMDTKEGNGVEVVVNLEENVMSKFENDVEHLKNISLNPSN